MYSLNEQDINLINNVMLPFLRTLKYQKLTVAAFELDGTFLFLSDRGRKTRRGKTNVIIGTKYATFEDNSGILVKEKEKIRKQVIEFKKSIQYLYISNNIDPEHKLEFPIYMAHHIPFFNSAEEVIATYIISSPVAPLNFEKIMFGSIEKLKNQELTVDLSKRQHEILFLLCYNINQNKIADYLGITRGTVSKIIFEQLISKFDNVFNIESLVERAIECGITYRFPPTLIRPRIFVVEHD